MFQISSYLEWFGIIQVDQSETHAPVKPYLVKKLPRGLPAMWTAAYTPPSFFFWKRQLNSKGVANITERKA